jgi:C-terminal processing protease CtpA/Prc
MEYEQAVGAKVVKIGNHPVEEVFEAVKPLIGADNEMEILNNSPYYMAMPAVLYGLNLIPQKDRASYGFEAQDGSEFALEIQPVSKSPEAWLTIYEKAGVKRPLYEQDRQSFYWYQYLPEENAVYVQYNMCAEQEGKPFQEFMEEVLDLLDQHENTRLVLDLRFNGGGNEAILSPFIKAIQARPTLNTPETLFVIIGRSTYSSALQNAITLGKEANAVLVGEPTGGKPNHYGEVRRFRLPNVGLLVQYSTRYWLNDPESDPLTLEPDISATATFADLLAGRDPALEAALQP